MLWQSRVAGRQMPMGVLYEIVSTPFAYAERPFLSGDEMFAGAPKSIGFGPGRLQHCVIWEPAEVVHEEPVLTPGDNRHRAPGDSVHFQPDDIGQCAGIRKC